MQRARALVLQRLATGEPGAREWLELLYAPLETLIEALTTDNERMVHLRQMTPFVGILEPRARWELWRTTR